MPSIEFRDLADMDYKKAWDFQESLFAALTQHKYNDQTHHGRNYPDGYLLFVEHPHVFTLGKSGEVSNLLVNEDVLQQHGASFYRINRGGDITYHGPGQIVGYPILNLQAFGLGIRDYVFALEQAIINTLEHIGIASGRIEGASGVWLETGKTTHQRKICAIGVRASHGITMHGFAFNVNTDLSFYRLINPCGFTDRGVTSVEQETGKKADVETIKSILKAEFAAVFKSEIIDGLT